MRGDVQHGKRISRTFSELRQQELVRLEVVVGDVSDLIYESGAVGVPLGHGLVLFAAVLHPLGLI